MRKSKQIVSACLALVLTCCLSIPASAGFIASKETTGYGTLYGRMLQESGAYKTQIDRNPDNAYLAFRGQLQRSTGEVITTSTVQKSGRGVTVYANKWVPIVNAQPGQSFFGTHGVQGGLKYKSDAVYTSLVVS